MALDLKSIGKKIGPLNRKYDWKDAVLYALGVGAGFAELDYCYEKNLKIIPGFSMATIFDFFWQVGEACSINPAGVLHGEQDLIFHQPIPREGILTTEGRITHIYDQGKSKGALVVAESDTRHSNGARLFTAVTTLFGRLDGGFGGQKAPKKKVEFPDREPDFTIEERPPHNQPLIYRLSGDFFELHVDLEFARHCGFEKPIMHGLCTFGFACRALVQSLVPGQPEWIRRLACRFSAPLYPGTLIQTLIWKTGKGKAVWQTLNAENRDVVINNGIVEYGAIPSVDAHLP
jgi:acyl dehydratase